MSDLIVHESKLPKYAPPGHDGTVNIRLVDTAFCGRFEMVLGTLEPGGVAHRHHHDVEAQIVYVLEGSCSVELGTEPAVTCGPGTIIKLPPKLDHLITSNGDVPLKIIVIYSPPLPPRNDVPVDG